MSLLSVTGGLLNARASSSLRNQAANVRELREFSGVVFCPMCDRLSAFSVRTIDDGVRHWECHRGHLWMSDYFGVPAALMRAEETHG